MFVFTAFIKSISPGLEGGAIMDGASIRTTVRKVIFAILAPV